MHVPSDTNYGKPYLDAAAELISDWSVLCDHKEAPCPSFREATRYMVLPPPTAGGLIRSRLTADGAPVELCERLGPTCGGPAYTIDPVPFVADPVSKLDRAQEIAARLLRSASGNSAIVEQSRAVLSPRSVPEEQASLWIGVVHHDNGGGRIKFYYNFGDHWTKSSRSRVRRCLQQLDLVPDRSASSMLAHLGRYASLRQLGLSVTRSGRPKAKLYYRLRRVNLQQLDELAHSAGFQSQAFHLYVRRMLGAGSAWCDLNAGIGIALNRGKIEALALYHYTRPYFRDDAALRHRVLEIAPEFGWDNRAYRSSSRLLAAPNHPRLRTLIGFGVAHKERTGMNIYARTGHLIPLSPTNEATKHHEMRFNSSAS